MPQGSASQRSMRLSRAGHRRPPGVTAADARVGVGLRLYAPLSVSVPILLQRSCWQRRIAALGLTNVEIRQADLVDLRLPRLVTTHLADRLLRPERPSAILTSLASRRAAKVAAVDERLAILREGGP